jgi:hypothetical protein
MYVIPVSVRRFAPGYTRCSFSPASALSRGFLVRPTLSPFLRWFRITPAAFPMLRWYRFFPAPFPMLRWYRISSATFPMSRWYRISPAAFPMSRWYRISPAPSPMSRWSLVFSAPVHCRSSQAVLVHHGSKYRHVALLRSTFRRSRVFYGRELPSVDKYVSLLYKYCVYSACMVYDYTLYVFVNLCHLSMSVVEWCIQYRISRINSGSSKARYITFQLSRNLYLRHDFQALRFNFILKNRQQEDLQNIVFLVQNIVFLILQVPRGASQSSCFFLHRAPSCRPPRIPKPSKPSYMLGNIGATMPQ